MKKIDLVINPSWIIPVEPTNQYLTNHSVVVDKGIIVDILPSDEAKQKYIATEIKHLPGEVVIPGFINAHTHNPLTLLRGIANDLPLMEWLQEHIWPTEKRWVGEEFVTAGVQLAITEMLRSGTTCFNDNFFFPETIAATTVAAGMRASIGGAILDKPIAWAKTSQMGIDLSLKFIHNYNNHPLISPTFCPHAPYTVEDKILQQIAKHAAECKVPIHMHLHETATEIQMSLQEYKMRPIRRLANLGMLGENFIAVHMTQIDAEDMEIIKDSKIHIVHCPESNCKLASGICPTANLVANNINVSCGTDGVASNNDLDMFGEMRMAAMLAKVSNNNPAVLPAAQVLEMATINGAKALGLADKIGSIEIGKQADLVAVNFSHPATIPLYDPIAQLIYSAGRDQVSNVWVQGKQLLSDGELTTINETEVLQHATEWQQKIIAHKDN